jgi:hypothetical protein
MKKEIKLSQVERKMEGIENVDYVVCKLCKRQMKAIQGPHLKHAHNITSKQYREMFPDAKMLSDDYTGGFRQHKGKHMKEEKYRKMFSEMNKGEKNINSKCRTTEQQRKERSPFAKEFYDKRGLSEDHRSLFNTEVAKNRSYTTQIDYYINKGFSNKEAKIYLFEKINSKLDNKHLNLNFQIAN